MTPMPDAPTWHGASEVNSQVLVLGDLGVVVKAAALFVAARERVSAHALFDSQERGGRRDVQRVDSLVTSAVVHFTADT